MHRLSNAQRFGLSAVLMLAAVIWIFVSLRGRFDQVVAAFLSFRAHYVGISIIPVMGDIFMVSYVYFLILSGLGLSGLSRRAAMLPLLASKIIRYLPGKIWGIAYQVNITDCSIPINFTLRANIEHFLLVNINSIAVAAGVFTYYKKGAVTALPMYAAALFFVFLFLRVSLTQRAISLVIRLTSAYDASFRSSIRDKNKDLLILGLMQSAWLFYYLAFSMILPAHFGLGDIVIIATCYAVAGIICAFVPLMPNGLLIREGSFIGIAEMFGYDPVDMFAFSIVARIIFTLADVLCTIIGTTLIYINGGIKRDEGYSKVLG